MWKVTYSDGRTDEFEDMTLELVCVYVDDNKKVVKIEWIEAEMSVIVKDMEMPKTCCYCPLLTYNPELIWDYNGIKITGAWLCQITSERIDNTKREEHCPLVKLPPHGDLIDKQKMKSDLLTVDPQYKTMIDWCYQVTDAQPIVIEAEGELDVDSD